MPSLPHEFTREAVAAASGSERQLFRCFHGTSEPRASLARQRLTFIKNKTSPSHLSNDDSHYYNTTGSAMDHWKTLPLPQPTRDIEACRRDLRCWGYCLVSDAMSDLQCTAMRERTMEQAAGERAAGVGLWLNASASGSNTQFVTTLLNKGRCFEGACEFDPAYVQAAPLIEQLLSEALGGDFLLNSFQAIIAHQHNYPQELHQDMNGSRCAGHLALSPTPPNAAPGSFGCVHFVAPDIARTPCLSLISAVSHAQRFCTVRSSILRRRC